MDGGEQDRRQNVHDSELADIIRAVDTETVTSESQKPHARLASTDTSSSPQSIDLVARGLVDLKPLLTHTFKFTEALEAFEITKNGKDKDGKFVIKCVIDGPE